MAQACETFLTQLNGNSAADADNRRAELFSALPDTISSQILSLHNELRAEAGQLDKKLTGLLDSHEQAFFSAYKSHMRQVKQEFRYLRRRADRSEIRQRRQERLDALSAELRWFQTEALRLDEWCKSFKRESERWRRGAETLEEDRAFLEEYVCLVRVHNKELRSRLQSLNDAAVAGGSDKLDAEMRLMMEAADREAVQTERLSAERARARELAGADRADRAAAAAVADAADSDSEGNDGSPQRNRAKVSPGAAAIREPRALPAPVEGVPGALDSLPAAARTAEALRRTVTILQKQISHTQQSRAALAAQPALEASDLEALLQKCAQVVQGRVFDRKRANGAPLTKTLAQLATATGRATRQPSLPGVWDGPTEVPFSMFTATDRRECLDLFLSSELALEVLRSLRDASAGDGGGSGADA